MNYTKRMNRALQQLPPSGIRKFFDLASDMPDVISLGVGEPDFVTPWDIRDSAINSIKRGFTQYTSNKGLPELCTLIGRYLDTRFGLKYDPDEEIMVTVGASEAIDLALRSICERGDEVLIPEPCYVSYMPCATLSGAKPVPIPLSDDNGFKLTPESLKKAITRKTKALILPYPCNPTGGIMKREDLAEIADVLKKSNIFVISDEIYAELTYGQQHVSIASLPKMRERTIVINGFSKSFAMTGWRLGYACAPKEIIQLMLRIHQYTIMCAPTFSQYAAVAALEQGLVDGFSAVEEMKEQYNLRRRFLSSALCDLGLSCFEPRGAFYVFPSTKATGLSGDDFAERLLLSQHVACVPGSAFGADSPNHVRCCYATSMKKLHEAMDRIEFFLKELGI